MVTYTIDELSTPVRGLPGNETDRISIHSIGHNESYSGVPADKIRENIRIGQIAPSRENWSNDSRPRPRGRARCLTTR